MRLSDLRQRALAFINETDDDSYNTQAVINGYINDGYLEMVASNPSTAIEDVWSFSTSVDVRGYTLPVGFLKAGRVFYGGVPVHPGAVRDMNFWSTGSGWPTLYAFWGDKLIFGPSPPSEIKTVDVYHTREPVLMSEDDDEPDGVPNFLRAGLYYYACGMLLAGMGDPQGTDTKMMARFKEYTKRYVEWKLSSGRDEFQVVRDTSRDMSRGNVSGLWL